MARNKDSILTGIKEHFVRLNYLLAQASYLRQKSSRSSVHSLTVHEVIFIGFHLYIKI